MSTRLAAIVLALALPGTAHAAGGELGGGDLRSILWGLFNLALLVGAIVYFGRKPIREFFAERRRVIADALDSSAKLLSDAEARLADGERRVARLEGELDDIRARATRRTEADREQILQHARATAERIRRDAGLAIAQEARRARERLREEAAALAIELATEILHHKVTDRDRDQLVDEFIARIEDEAPAARPAAGR